MLPAWSRDSPEKGGALAEEVSLEHGIGAEWKFTNLKVRKTPRMLKDR